MEQENKVVEVVETPSAAQGKENKRPHHGPKGDRRQGGRPQRRPQEKLQLKKTRLP